MDRPSGNNNDDTSTSCHFFHTDFISDFVICALYILMFCKLGSADLFFFFWQVIFKNILILLPIWKAHHITKYPCLHLE